MGFSKRPCPIANSHTLEPNFKCYVGLTFAHWVIIHSVIKDRRPKIDSMEYLKKLFDYEYLIMFQKFQKIRKLYSPDPDSGSGISEI